VHSSILQQLPIMENTVSEQLVVDFEIQAELHASRVRSRRDRAWLTTRTVIQHIVELKEIASAACTYFVMQR
jgi:hypothetical protein